MKRDSANQRPADDDLLPEYHFDYAKARPNRFAAAAAEGLVVVLDDDIARVFKTPESVKAVLRALIATMPSDQPAKRSSRSAKA
jgi:hypothetical protein